MFIFIGILFLVLSFFEFVFRKTKLKLIFLAISVFLFTVIQTKITWAPDLENYHFHYYNVNDIKENVEPFHILFIKICNSLFLSFEEFYFFYGIIILFFLILAIKKLSPLPVMVLSIFFIIPYYPNITQIRSFLSLAIFLNAIIYYKENKLLFWTFYVISVLCHYSMLGILPFFLIKRFQIFNNYNKSNIILLVILLSLSFIPRSILSQFIILINPKYEVYIDKEVSYIGSLGLIFPFYLLNNFVLYHYKNYKKNLSQVISNKLINRLDSYMEFIMYSNYLIALQYFIRDFSRITMFLSILSYSYISIIVYYNFLRYNSVTNKHFYRILIIIWAITTFLINFVIINDAAAYIIIEKIFNSNYILN